MITRALLFLCCFAVVPASAAPDSDAEPVVVSTRHVPPFSIRTENGWTGLTIELLRRIAEDQGFDFSLREMSLTEMLDAVDRGEVTAAAAALTITSERERLIDFSHPYFTSGLGVAVPVREQMTWISALGRVASGPFLHSLAALLGILALLGALVWLAERRHNAQFAKRPVQGIGSGIWWSAVTMTTVGYGDKAPVTPLGRTIALVWMFASVILISSVTAAIASSLTVGELDQTLTGLEDLHGKRVLTAEGSSSAAFLTEELVRHDRVATIEQALDALAAGRADAVVYDVPILRYLINANHRGELRVLPTLLSRQDYGIALPAGSTLREELNRQILTIIQEPEWDRLVKGYLGRDGA